MDGAADTVGKETSKPNFYYAEESQQNLFKCSACGDTNDILGRYGYCSCCGTHNGLQELETEIANIKKSLNAGQQCEACAKETVSVFDGYARQLAKQLVRRIPMTPDRRNEWQKKLFHNLKIRAEEFKRIFDIDVLKGLSQSDIDFAVLMFHRRHLFEHNGGEVDERYIRESGDTSVRLKQIIRETQETVLRVSDLVTKIAGNLHNGFHEIFPPEQLPLKYEARRKKLIASNKKNE